MNIIERIKKFYYEDHLKQNAIAQIEELVAMHENAKNEQMEKEQLIEQVKLQDEAINELASLVSDLMMKGAE